MTITKVSPDLLDLDAGITISVADNSDTLTLTSTDADATSGPVLNLYRNSASAADGDILGLLKFTGNSGGSGVHNYGQIRMENNGVTDGQEQGKMIFEVSMTDGTLAKCFNVGRTEVSVNEDSKDINFRVESDDNTHALFVNGGKDYVAIGTNSDFAAGASVLHLHQPDASSNAYLHITQQDGGATASDGLSIGVLDGGVNSSIRLRENGYMNFYTNNTERMRILADGKVGIGTDSAAQLLHVETTASPIATFRYNSSNRVDIRYDGLDTYGGNFRMMLAGSEQFRFGTTGVLGVSTTTLKSAGDNPTDENSTVIGPGYLYLQRDDSASINQIIFGKDGQTVGNIITTTATSYVSASDYRMKENVDYTWDATSRLKQLKPARYNWIADETNTLEDGFLAHEVATVVPNAVFGEKDAVDSDGNPEMQGVDSSKLIPLLVKTIQELEARITTLES